MVVVKIKTTLTNCHDFLCFELGGSQPIHEGQHGVDTQFGIVGVQTNRGPHVVVASSNGKRLLRGVGIGANHYHFVYVVGGGIGDGCIGTTRCAFVIHVTVRVDPLHSICRRHVFCGHVHILCSGLFAREEWLTFFYN